MNYRRFIGLCLFFACVPLTAESLTEQRQRELLDLLHQDCGACHGLSLKGGLGPPLLPENLTGKPLAYLSQTILHGRPGTAMPPWQGILTKNDAEWLAEQLLNTAVDPKP